MWLMVTLLLDPLAVADLMVMVLFLMMIVLVVMGSEAEGSLRLGPVLLCPLDSLVLLVHSVLHPHPLVLLYKS